MRVTDVEITQTVEVKLKLTRTACVGDYEPMDFSAELLDSINEFCENNEVDVEEIKIDSSSTTE